MKKRTLIKTPNLDKCKLEKKIDKNNSIYKLNGKCYMVMEKRIDSDERFIDCEPFISEMHGIKNFIYGKNLEFYDEEIRILMKKIDLIKAVTYIRFGAAGGDLLESHPGGEILELQYIMGSDCSGISHSCSGYLENENGYSKAIELSLENQMIENRMVYSHTVFIPQIQSQEGIKLKLEKSDDLDLLPYIMEETTKRNIRAFAVKVRIKSINDKTEKQTNIIGRVLKHKPSKKMTSIKDATNIGNEKSYILDFNQEIIAYGTYYLRNEVEWSNFTNGKKYEKNGHYHAKILNKANEKQHEVFHLREAIIQSDSIVNIKIFPIHKIARIEEVVQENNKFICPITSKSVKTLISEFNL